jgi:hypothetical protein
MRPSRRRSKLQKNNQPPVERVLSDSFIQSVVRFWRLLENLYPEMERLLKQAQPLPGAFSCQAHQQVKFVIVGQTYHCKFLFEIYLSCSPGLSQKSECRATGIAQVNGSDFRSSGLPDEARQNHG